MSPLVSMIVPVYNVEKYLERCIESIVDQSYQKLEIILIDDGSTDSSSKKCDAWEKKDSRIKVVHQHNMGLGMARNTGIKIATADYLMFVDSDDFLLNNTVELLLKRIMTDKSDMAIGKRVHVFEDGSTKQEERCWFADMVLSPDELFMQEQLGYGKMSAVEAWGKIYRRELFSSLEYPTLKCAEDLWVYPTLVSSCKKISIVDAPVYCYYNRYSSITHSLSFQSQIDELTAILNCCRFFYERGFIEGAKSFFLKSIDKSLKIEQNYRQVYALWDEYFSNIQIRKMLKGLGPRSAIKYMCVRNRKAYLLLKGIREWLTHVGYFHNKA